MIKEHIDIRFPGKSDHAVAYRNEIVRVCATYADSEISDRNFTDEIVSGEDSKFWSRLSEALIFDRLQDKNIDKREDAAAGPDFPAVSGQVARGTSPAALRDVACAWGGRRGHDCGLAGRPAATCSPRSQASCSGISSREPRACNGPHAQTGRARR